MIIIGRPGGPSFYISTVDNTHNHGPGSQGMNNIGIQNINIIMTYYQYDFIDCL